MITKIVLIKRTTFVRARGRHIRFTVFSVCRSGFSFGLGKAKSFELSVAISHSYINATSNMFFYNIYSPNYIDGCSYRVGKTTIFLLPSNRRGLFAGGCARVLIRFLGISDILTFILGTKNKSNLLLATFLALKKMYSVNIIN